MNVNQASPLSVPQSHSFGVDEAPLGSEQLYHWFAGLHCTTLSSVNAAVKLDAETKCVKAEQSNSTCSPRENSIVNERPSK